MRLRTNAAELLQPLERVERVAADEVLRALDGLALAPVLEAPVRLELRLLREVEVEMRRPPRRACGAREHDAQHVGVLVVGDQRAEAEQVAARLRREPPLGVRRRPPGRAFAGGEACEHVSQLALEHERVVRTGLDAHQQAVERGDVDARRVEARLERLDERRARAGERIEHATARGHVAAEELLDELRDVLAEIRVQAVHVLRPHALRQVGLGPREIQVEAVVDLLLGDAHSSWFHGPRRASCLEGVRHVLEPARAVGDHVEAHGQPLRLRHAARATPRPRAARAAP